MVCPHCEKIFKQSGRYTDHLKKCSEKSPVDPSVTPVAAGASTLATAPSATGRTAGGPGMMKVGSKAGYYNSKSPKMMLAETCVSEKRIKARIKATDKGSNWSCKVVLPHPKKSELDVVVFLPESMAAESKEEAEERGCLAALHAISGHRNLERILPKAYLPLWQELNEAAKAKEQKEIDRMSRAETAAARKKKSNEREIANLKKSQQVAMSCDKVTMMQKLIEQNRFSQDTGNDSEYTKEASEADLERLRQVGFTDDQVEEALDANQHDPSYNVLMDWLCVHIESSQLPKAVRGKSAMVVSVLRVGVENSLPHSSIQAATADPTMAQLTQFGYSLSDAFRAMKLSDSVAAGWCLLLSQIAQVPISEGLPVIPFSDSLMDKIVSEPNLQATTSETDCLDDWEVISDTGGDEDLSSEWRDEQLVLRSMHEDSVLVCTPSCTVMQMIIPADIAIRYAVTGHDVPAYPTLKVIVANWPGCKYPTCLPLFALKCEYIPGAILLELTSRAAAYLLANCVDSHMIHDLYSFVYEQLLDESALPALGTAVRRHHDLLSHMDADSPDAAVPTAVSGTTGRQRSRGGGGRGQRPGGGIAVADFPRETTRLRELMKHNQDTERMGTMRRTRERLPAYKSRRIVIDSVIGHRVTVIAGATGCGKSTQVPQYILEHEIADGLGAETQIVCTQPRRLPAIALATRVSAEMGIDTGSVVGYSVRLQKSMSSRTRLLFCTTGILLRRLMSHSDLEELTHIIVDEVHERSLDSDLLLLMLCDVLRKHPRLRLVLMSATADAALFATYFDDALRMRKKGGQGDPVNVCAVVTIPGFTYPVRVLTLEDALQATGLTTIARGRGPAKPQGASKISKDDRNKEKLALASKNMCDADGEPYSEQTLQTLIATDESVINYDLIEAVIGHIVQSERTDGPFTLLEGWSGLADAPDMGRTELKGQGAILVFLPGTLEISKMQRQLEESGLLRRALGGDSPKIWPLHGSLPPKEQQAVFTAYGPGIRKIVLATNVAETSLTIDDVTAVVDTGRMKETQFDSTRGLARLVETWVSQAASQQRKGRAGRVRPGICYRLYSRKTWNTLLPHQLPEMLRSPLESLCLQVKSVMGANSLVEDILARALSPPPVENVQRAIQLLRQRQALDSDEKLTPLGQHLVKMPLDPAVGKMLLFSTMLQCTDPVLTIAAAIVYGRQVFISPAAAREESRAARASIAGDHSAYRSDHLATVFAYNTWRMIRSQQGNSACRRWCAAKFVSFDAMDAIHAGRAEYANALADLGFVPLDYARQVRSGSSVDYSKSCDAKAENARMVKAAICAGFYPQVLRADNPPPKFVKIAAGAKEVEGCGELVKVYDREKGRVFVHPSSINFSVGEFESGWLVHTEMIETSKVFVRECSMVPLYSLLLFGGEITVDREKGTVKVDNWATFHAPAKIGILVRELRVMLSALLNHKVEHVETDVTNNPVILAMHELLSTDGF